MNPSKIFACNDICYRIIIFLIIACSSSGIFAKSNNLEKISKKWDSTPDIKELYAPVPVSDKEFVPIPEEFLEGQSWILKGNDKKTKKYFEILYEKTSPIGPDGFNQSGNETSLNDRLHAYAAYELAHFIFFGKFDPYYNGVPSSIDRTPLPYINHELRHNKYELERRKAVAYLHGHCNNKTKSLLMLNVNIFDCTVTYYPLRKKINKSEEGFCLASYECSEYLPPLYALLSNDHNFYDVYLPNYFFRINKIPRTKGNFSKLPRTLLAAKFWTFYKEGFPKEAFCVNYIRSLIPAYALIPYILANPNYANDVDWWIGKSEFEVSQEIALRISKNKVYSKCEALFCVLMGNDMMFPEFIKTGIDSHVIQAIYDVESYEEYWQGEINFNKAFLFHVLQIPEFKKYENLAPQLEELLNASPKECLRKEQLNKERKKQQREQFWNTFFQTMAMGLSNSFLPTGYTQVITPTIFSNMEFVFDPHSPQTFSPGSTIAENIWQQIASESINQVEAQNYANFLQFQESAQRLGQKVTYEQFMTIQGAALQQNNSTTYSHNDLSSTPLTQNDCPWCKGTGKTIYEASVPTFGIDTKINHCSECGIDYSGHSHAHITCKHCNGSGKLK